MERSIVCVIVYNRYVSFSDGVIYFNTKGRLNLYYDGHVFVMNKKINDRTFWACNMYLKTKCRKRLITVNGKVVKNHKMTLTSHNHF